jgi:Trk-type K+ transport system membrane component
MENYIIKNIAISAMVYYLIFLGILILFSGGTSFSTEAGSILNFEENYPPNLIAIFLLIFSISGLPLIVAAIIGAVILKSQIPRLIFLVVPIITVILSIVFFYVVNYLLIWLEYI